VNVSGPYPYRGEVTWLTAEQGGRRSGPPPDPSNYAQLAHVAPLDAKNGSSSFVLRGFDPAQYRSEAEGRWLESGNEGDHPVEAGTTIVVTEGLRTVAHFVVHEVLDEATS
jgi:hypothetical protein